MHELYFLVASDSHCLPDADGSRGIDLEVLDGIAGGLGKGCPGKERLVLQQSIQKMQVNLPGLQQCCSSSAALFLIMDCTARMKRLVTEATVLRSGSIYSLRAVPLACGCSSARRLHRHARRVRRQLGLRHRHNSLKNGRYLAHVFLSTGFGVATGAGINLIAACDIRLCTEDAMFCIKVCR